MESYAQTSAQGYGGVVAFGSRVDLSDLEWTAGGDGKRIARSCLGARCVALASTQFQYPIYSEDDGRTWRVAGHWFAGDWADGAAFATSISMLSPSVWLAPNGISPDGFYLTMDAGRRWQVVTVDGWATSNRFRHGDVLVSMRGTSHGHAVLATYATSTGATWRLVSIHVEKIFSALASTTL